LVEQKLKDKSTRKYVLSLRRDGIQNFDGEYQMTQMFLEEGELKQLKTAIEQMLAHNEQEEKFEK
jgi:soluble cytochrome b562